MSACIILAAGQSNRMGKPKHNLMFSETETFLDHIIRVYKRIGVAQIIVVANEFFTPEIIKNNKFLKIVFNKNPDYGRFYSIQLGLYEIKNTAGFIQNVDNPFVNAGLLMSLQNGLGVADYAVPVYEGRGGHPVLLSPETVKPLINNFKNSSNFKSVLKSFKRKNVIVKDPYIRVNINTPEDYKRYFSRQQNADYTDTADLHG